MGVQELHDIVFEDGATYLLIVDTDRYSFGFYRELCGYVTGINDKGQRGHREAQTCFAEEPEFVAGLKAKSTSVLHTDYGQILNTNWTTPNRRVDDYHISFDATPEPTGYPACDSVAVFFHEPPTVEEMVTIRKRAADYCAEKKIGLRAVRVVRVVKVTPSETELDL